MEAACIYCQQLPDRDLKHLEDGMEYMVVDLGGVYSEIAVIQKETNQVIEKIRITGNDCGGTSVNNNFKELLTSTFGSPFVASFRKENPVDYLDVMREFEVIKRSFKGQKHKINQKFPSTNLDCLCEKYLSDNLKITMSNSPYGKSIRLWNNKMQMKSDIILNLYKTTIDKIIYLLKNVIADYEDGHKITNCIQVQEAVRQTFSNKRIIIPEEPDLAVMRGPFLCEHQPFKYIQIEMKAALTSVKKGIFFDNLGIYNCTECKSAFCQQCRTKHDRLPTTKTHTITDLKKIAPSAV